jgi:probable HAF family extracellular repeat protein/uncharacterized repeat protein (TIGR03803 family)
MKIKHRVAALGIPLLFSVLVPVHGQNAYVLTKLTPPETYFSEAYAINDSGWVTLRVTATADSPQEAFLYNDGYLAGIGDLPGGMGNFPFALNNLGQVAGCESLPGDGSHEHAYLFSDGVLSDLGTLPGGYRTLAYAINDSAQIAGYVDLSNGTRHAFLYADGVMADLGTLGGTESAAEGVNNAGDVVGYSFTATRDIIHAFFYRGGVMTDLFSLTAGRAIEATAINNHGVVVGRSRSNHAFIFRDGILEELGTLGGSFSSAYAVNEYGQVVGYASAADNSAHAFLYGPETGMIDLNSIVTLSDGITPGFLNLNSAKGINELGQITGTGTYFDGSAQSTQAFLLTPTVPQTAAPEFSPAGGGPYTSVIWVTITSATSGATIRYTTDGSTPSQTAGIVYGGPFTISESTLLQAVAISAAGAVSPVTSANYTIVPLPTTAAPSFSPAGGTYVGSQVVTISTTTSDATIRYTTDGSTPSELSGAIYMGPLNLSGSVTLTAIAFASNYLDSPVASATYTIVPLPSAAAPSFSPAGGTYAGSQVVTISSATGGATIRYTTDGSTPTETNGTLYAGCPVKISATSTLKAIAYQIGLADSPVSSGLYTINSSPAASLNVVHDFAAFNNGGAHPYAGLIQSNDGVFRGTTGGGGSGYYGTVFQMTPAGAFTTLFSFDVTNGTGSSAGLIQGSDGNFYGTTGSGGSSYVGTVFQMTPAGALTTWVSFNGDNGANPFAGVIQGSDGNFYGTTQYGGSSNNGTVYMMTPAGVLTTLVSFNGDNGVDPVAGLVQGSDGNFYGTTRGGGSGNNGTVFMMTPAGVLTTLVSFDGDNGASPQAALIQGSDGNFYGTTGGGGSGYYGTVFQMTPAGVLTTLASFNFADGANPLAGLVQGSDGNFYGTTAYGGTTDNGTVFQITPAGVLTTLVSFNGANGANPWAGLVQASDGSFYGTTVNGGVSDDGVIFQLIVPPPTLNFEAENLAYVPCGAIARIRRDHSASNGKWVELAANGVGDSIRFRLHVAHAGLYQLSLRWKGDNDRGILCLKVDGKPVGSTLDQYAAGPSFRTTTFGSVYLAEGDHVIQLAVTGRRRGSHGFTVSADKFTLVGQ